VPDVELLDPPRPHVATPPSNGPLAPVGVALAILAGLALRLFVLFSSMRGTDSDEAVVSLIAMHAGRGDIDVMFWGQAYGGTIEAYLAAPLFRLFGPSIIVERLLLLVIAAVAAVLTWRVGKRLVGSRPAVVGALLFWTSSCYFVWWSTKLNIYYAALCLALFAGLQLLRLRDGDIPSWWPAAFGLAAGASMWSNPQTMFLLVPWTMATIRPVWHNLRTVLKAVPFALVGASPWIEYSIRSHWSTLKFPGVDVYLPYPERLLLFFRQLPIVFGVRLPMSAQWMLLPAARWALLAVLVALVAAGVARGQRGVRLLSVLVLAYALLYAVSPQVGQPGANLQPRYLLFIFPVLCLLVATASSSVRIRNVEVAAVFVVAFAVVVSAVGLHRMDQGRLTLHGVPPGVQIPADISDVTSLLREHDVTRAYSFYWLAYQISFETRERTIVTPAFTHITRYLPYADAVARAPHPAIIAMADTPEPAAIERRLVALQVPFEEFRRGAFVVIVADRQFPREELASAFREAGIFA